MLQKLMIAALAAALLGTVNPAFAQETSTRKIGFQVRLGAMGFTPLVEDAVRSRAVADSIDADQSDRITVRQQIAPAVTLAALLPLRERTGLELSAGFATSSLRGEDDFESWRVATVTVANALLGVSYAYRPAVIAHGGVGITRLFGGDQGMFSKGNGIRPLVEAGVSVVMPAYPSLQLDARAQTHTFATAALRDEDAAEGSVLRVVISGSYTLGRSGQ